VLNPLVIACDLIGRHPGDPAIVENSRVRMERSLHKAMALLDGLLAFARASEAPSAAGRAAIADEAAAVVHELEPAARASGAAVALEIEPALEVACGPWLLHVVLLNLVGNAVKFMAQSERRQVTVRARGDGGEAIVEVEDTGPGIPAEALPRIFEPFYRAPGARTPGHGIGLATVQRVLAACGGRIEVSSTVGAGTRFRLRLPRAKAQPEPAPTQPQPTT
jgi:two-component system, NtrC family, sensor kinase